jgi:putative phosphoesterase
MRIGVVSDTQDHLKNVERIVGLFNEARVDAVVHTGDVSRPKTLDVLAGLDAPLWGVWGNNDAGEYDALVERAAALGFAFSDPPLELHWHGRHVIVVHDPLEFDGALAEHHGLALHGHTHRRRIETAGGTLFFNPGECAGHMKGLNAVGVVDLATLEADLLHF